MSYRSRFYQMMQEADSDPEWFLEDLETITKSNEKNNQLQLENAEPPSAGNVLPVALPG